MNGSQRPTRAIDYIDTPLRGAPLAAILMLIATGSGFVVGGMGGDSTIVVILLSLLLITLLVAPIWMCRLAELRWPPEPPRPRQFELVVRLVCVLLLAGVVLSAMSRWDGLAWALFGVHCAFTLVAIPIELRRYPGVLPRAVR